MDPSKTSWLKGILLVIAVAIIWIASSYVVQSVESNGISPLLLTYICNSLFVVLIPMVEYSMYMYRIQKNSSYSFIDGTEKIDKIEKEAILLESSTKIDNHLAKFDAKKENGWTRKKIAKISLLICPFWFTAQLTYNLSLAKTSVSSNTIISSTSSLFTFILSVIFLKERFTLLKLFGVLACVFGTVIVSVVDRWNNEPGDGEDSLNGDFLCLLSSFIYAVYTCLLRALTPSEGNFDENDREIVLLDGNSNHLHQHDVIIKEENFKSLNESKDLNTAMPDNTELSNELTMEDNSEEIHEQETIGFSTALLFGYIGVFNFLFIAPIVFIIYFFKLSVFTFPSIKQFGLIVAKGLFDNVLSDYLWARAILLTSPVAATTGLQLQIPISLVVDSITEGEFPGVFRIFGSVMVILGVLGITLPVLLSSED